VAAGQEVVGEVLFAQGAITAQRGTESPRFLVQGDPLVRGETISTGARGFAQLALRDGTRLSLRPNTRFNVTGYSQQSGSENLAMELLRGGLRAISGLISKAGPDRMRVQTGTATIGVRGTEFDARLCQGDCAAEQRATGGVARGLAQERVVARVARLNGSASAVDAKGATRALAQDAALFEGETVRTASGSSAVLAFRDQSVLTVAPASELRLENVRVGATPAEGTFVVRLLTGGLRLLTGQIARANPRAVRVQTSTATIGVRGRRLHAVHLHRGARRRDHARAAGRPGGGDSRRAGRPAQSEGRPAPGAQGTARGRAARRQRTAARVDQDRLQDAVLARLGHRRAARPVRGGDQRQRVAAE
jgi:hypothetical protein